MSDPIIHSQNLTVLFAALDTLLSLHYASSTTVPKINDLCVKATQLTKKRTDPTTFELILTYDPQAYRIILFGSKSLDYGVCTPEGISPLRFGTLLPHRKSAFEKLVLSSKCIPMPLVKLSEIAIPYLEVSEHIKRDQNSTTEREVPSASTSDLSTRTLNSIKCDIPGISPRGNASKISKLELSNRSPRFTLKKPSSSGLSLLQRIRLKETKAKQEVESDSAKDKYSLYIKSKAPAVYDVLYELTLQNAGDSKSFKTIPMGKLVSIIGDSFPYKMTEKEISDAIQEVASLLSNKVQILCVGEIHAVKIFRLERNLDLSILKGAR